ncbi:MarR family winged helix-turn-helix transcriptional regulator [Mesorhizobium sp. INR15]|uniref:MarR family winged helix-turn-helix transcriptional regulator n=1 Tax=Mesorhizobium sp. INR15 TaxID=2654248 RepID=UPI0018968B62|nr:MarR family winged helix-turn-helix transcriptional regulator [Mesorhizobium sp. INR15]QPC91376.1 winged helix DNA-binding protein [Mesorhizobium sp. INR15]
MTKAQPPGFSLCNNATLRRAGRSLGRFYDDMLAPSGLKGTQFGLLFQIHASTEPAMGTLAEALIMDLSALGHTLKPLIRDGYVETFADASDRRVKRVRLTPRGEMKLEEAIKLWSVAQQRFEAVVGQQKATDLRAMLDEVAALDLETPTAAPSA